MTADDAFDIASAGFAYQGAFEIVEDVEGHLPMIGEEFRKREAFDLPFYFDIQRQSFLYSIDNEIIETVAPAGHRAAQERAVELIAVKYQKFAAIDKAVDYPVSDLNAEATRVAYAFEHGDMPHGFIVVAGDIDDLGAFMCFSEKLIENFADRFVPVPAFMKFPSIDDVADQIERVGFRFAQEIEKGGGIEGFGADMKIGQED